MTSLRAQVVERLATPSAVERPRVRAYAIALGVGLAALGLRAVSEPMLGPSAGFLFAPLAVLAAAWYGGWGPGLACTALVAFGGEVLSERSFTQGAVSLARVSVFLVAGAIVTSLVALLQQARRQVRGLEERRAQDDQRAAEERAQEVEVHRQAWEATVSVLSNCYRVVDCAEVLIAQGLATLAASGGGVALVDAGADGLQVRHLVGYPPEARKAQRFLPLDERSPLTDAVKSKRMVLLESPSALAASYPRLRDERAGLVRQESLAVVPLFVGERPLGVMFFAFTSPRHFDREDVEFLKRLGAHAGRALERARVYEAERAARISAEASDARNRFLAEASALLASSTEVEANLAEVARQLLPVFADACLVHLAEPDGTLRLVAAAHRDPERSPSVEALGAAGSEERQPATLFDALRGADSALLLDVSGVWASTASPDAVRVVLEDLQIGSLVGVPLRGSSRTVGRLTLLTSRSSRRFGPEDLSFAADLGQRAGLAVENGLLLAEARQLNKLKDEFLSVLSHELRTPLGAVLLWTELLRSESLPAGATRSVEMIERSTRSLAQLITELLDVSRIVAGKLTVERFPTDLPALVRGVFESARSVAEAKQVALELEVEGHFEPALADPNRMRQAVENVVMNALKFTSAGGTVQLRLVRDGARALVVVSDTGVGIPAETLPHVFQRFRHGDRERTRASAPEGLGLGLHIAHHIVERHAGRITVASEGRSKGSVFTIEFPLLVPPGGGTSVAAEEPERAARPLAGRRVLLVDDHEDTLRGLTLALQNGGAEVTSASSVREAFAVFDDCHPDVIVSDLAMPEKSGYEFIREVRCRTAEDGGTAPAVAVSAYASREDRERALAAGFQMHLAKPVDVPLLIETDARLAKPAAQPPRA